MQTRRHTMHKQMWGANTEGTDGGPSEVHLSIEKSQMRILQQGLHRRNSRGKLYIITYIYELEKIVNDILRS